MVGANLLLDLEDGVVGHFRLAYCVFWSVLWHERSYERRLETLLLK